MGYKKWIFIIIISLCAFTLFKCFNTSDAKNLCLRIKIVNNLTNEPISDVKILVEESILGRYWATIGEAYETKINGSNFK